MKTSALSTSFQAISAALVLLALGASAHAQAPRYTFRELVKPLAAAYCSQSQFRLNEAGEVATACSYKGGSRTETKLWCPLGTMAVCFPYKGTSPWYYDLPVVWSANGTVRMLNVPGSKKPSLSRVGLTNTGDVIAAGNPLKPDGLPTDPDEAWIWRGTATIGASSPRPATVPQDYKLREVTSGGRMLWRPYSGEKPMVALPDGQVLAVPEMPPATLKPYLANYETYLNDQGMYIRARALIQPRPPTQLDQDVRLQVWFHDGQRWTEMPIPPSDTVSFPTMSVNAKGHVVYNESGARLWRLEEPGTVESLPDFEHTAFIPVINDNDVIGGRRYVSGYHATILMGGTGYDLNTVTSGVPKGWVLEEVIRMNNKAQMIVLVRDPSKKDNDYNRFRYALLTPQ